jgi:poly[(R)-3-hydroxyalkanoate] polymerase subunit PhaC
MPVPDLTALDPRSLVERVRRDVERNALRARNGIRLGLASTRRTGATPKDVVWRRGRTELWHYRNDRVTVSPPLLIVWSLVSRSYILDLAPGNSFIERLLQSGFDVYLLDWGEPDERDAQNRLEDYTDDYLPAAIERVLGDAGADETSVLGYCFGGNLALLHAAHHPRSPVRNLTVMATPADFSHMGPLADVFRVGDLDVDDVLDENGNLPPRVIAQAFKALKPAAAITRYVDLWERLWNDEYVASYQAMTSWTDDQVPFPGAAARDTARMLLRDNGMMTDRLRLAGDRVHLADVDLPFLMVTASRDHIVPLAAAQPLIDLVGSPDKHVLQLDAGHIGLVVGRTAAKVTIPRIIEFLLRRSEVAA